MIDHNISRVNQKIRYTNDIRSIKNSDYYGYWLRLKKLGFHFVGTKTSFFRKANSNVIYLKTHWKFKCFDETVYLIVSRHKQRLIIKDCNVKLIDTSSVNGSFLEKPFLQYFKQTDKPLFIKRLGKQSKKIMAWQQSWLKHIENNGKFAKKLKKMGIFDSAQIMPVQTHKPRPRCFKPRKG